jgi:surface-anchored protein
MKLPVLPQFLSPILAAGLSLVATAHVHVQIGFPAGQWDLHVLDYEAGPFAPAEYPLVVGAAARQRVPDDPRFTSALGLAGGPVWILPQNEAAGLLNLGVGTSGISAGVFAGNQLRLELRHVEGPGDFALFSISPFGAPTVHLASRDGTDPAVDFLTVPAVNGHLHVNWAFTAPGTYRVGLAARGTLAATGQSAVSPVTDYVFVVPAPQAPVLGTPRLLADGSVELIVTGPADALVEIQAAPLPGVWAPLGSLRTSGAPQTFSVPASVATQRFFRAYMP